ncbi:DUF3089 domain-containing protein [Parasediminibacterium paludis]|uniref:DUF3089 domain-containing protein n=1 Tax=Parasediminibacterium paludis TaxID=908966 RepID=A0ABV8PUK7_9BACT
MKYHHIYFYLTLFFLVGCANKYHRFASNYQFKAINGKPDYSQLNFWAAHPYKHDPSDSIPKPLVAISTVDSSVDVFFIHPTTYTSANKEFGNNAPVDNADLNAKTDYSTILYQASVFNQAGRIFAPRYRQANIQAYYPITNTDTTEAIAAFELAYQDIKTAFNYYLEHFNNGRPIIIASHSQGTTHAKRLLKEFFDTTALKNKLVAAYLVGIPVETNWLTNIKPCETPTQTGCVCSWRTFKDGYQPNYVAKETPVIVTNPLTWDSAKPLASRAINKGSILLNFNKLVPKVADANITGNILWTRKPHFFGNIFYTSKNYHIADYNLYYINIRENANERIKAFFKH